MKPIENTQEGTTLIEQMISDVLKHNHQFKFVVIGMEAIGFYGVHLTNYLSASELPTPFSVRVYCLNPKEIKNSKKSFNDIGKNDGLVNSPIEDLIAFINSKSKSRIADTEEIAKMIQTAARNSYRLDKVLYQSQSHPHLTVSVPSEKN